MNFFNLPSSVQQLKSKFLDDHGVELWLKRDDLIHTEISGNKWRKLKYNIQEATNRGHHKLLTFGGAYSNH
ncbi:MAG: 1-aminocyclopropane-1-carboxylate deaminase, partial [Vicingaceae bacterium]